MNDLRTQLRDGLVRGIPTFERHRRRRRAAVGGAVATVAVAAGGALVASRAQDDDGVRVDTTAPPTTTTVVPDPTTTTAAATIRPGGVTEPVDVRGVAATVVATGPSGAAPTSVSVLDLATGTRTTYPSLDGELGYYSGIAVTNAGLLIAWQPFERPRAYPMIGSELGPGVEFGNGGGNVRVVPTLAGDEAWVYEYESGRLELADLTTGITVLSTQVDEEMLLRGVRDRDAILVDRHGQPDEQVHVVDAGGNVETLEPPEPGASFVAATGDAVAWVVGADLKIVRSGGLGGKYGAGGFVRCAVGGPAIPTDSPNFPTVTTDGRYLLIGICNPVANPTLSSLHRIDLTTMEHEGIVGGGPSHSVGWSRDGRHLVAIRQSETGAQVEVIDVATGTTTSVTDPFPAGSYVLAVG